jgi:phage antirepressor YoqD-like protein
VKVIETAEKEKYGKAKIVHHKAMKKILKLSEEPSFGGVSKMDIPTFNPDGTKNSTVVRTLGLTRKQAISTGARLSNEMLMNVIDYLETLESKVNTPQLTDMEILSRAVMISNQTIARLENKIAEDAPYNRYARTLVPIDTDMYLRDWVKLLHGEYGLDKDVGEQMVIHFLIEKKILFRKVSGKLAAHSKWTKNKHFNMSRGVNVISETKSQGYDKLHITAKGRDRFSPRIIEVFNVMTEKEKEKYKRKMKRDGK